MILFAIPVFIFSGCNDFVFKTKEKLNVIPPVREFAFGSKETVGFSPGWVAEFMYSGPSAEDATFEAVVGSTLNIVRKVLVNFDDVTHGIDRFVVDFRGEPSIIPDIHTNESYEIKWTSQTLTLTAYSISGVVYGITTVAQLLYEEGSLPSTSGEIRDSPAFVHRGLLVDTGRRFWPLKLLQETIIAMSLVKLNVLHLHFSDNCRFAIESNSHPELIPDDGQYLTQLQVRDLIDFAAKRGVRIVPEIDIPGHARGMRNAEGVTWISEDRVELADTFGTRLFLKQILEEFATLFPDEYFHVGGDETGDGVAPGLMLFVVKVLHDMGKKVIGWEEIVLEMEWPLEIELTVQQWKSKKLALTKPLPIIYSRYHNLYMELRPETRRLWLDIGAAAGAALLGGEIAMWTDHYTPLGDCWVENRPIPVARAFYGADKDEEFTKSIHRMLWSKGGIAASSFWNYDDSTTVIDEKFLNAFLVEQVEIEGCIDIPNECRCSELTGCPLATVAEPVVPRQKISQPMLTGAETMIIGPDNVLYVPAAPKEASFGGGIYLTKFSSFLGPHPSQMAPMAAGEPVTPSGDVCIYYVDAFYSSTAFTPPQLEGLELFLLGLSGNIGTHGTVFFVFDDAGKSDPFLFKEFALKFNEWVTHVNPRVGTIGIGLNVEGLTVEQMQPVLSSIKSTETKLQLILYDDDEYIPNEVVVFALESADSVLVHISGTEPEDIAQKAAEYILRHAKLFQQNQKNHVYVSFAVKSADVDQIKQALWRKIDDILKPAVKTKFFNLNNIIMVHPWEKVMR